MQNLDFLTPSGVKIKQSPDGYRFTSDAIALANFVKCKPSDIIIDAGCGGGVISLIINDNHKPKRIIAVDIDETAATLARENFAFNNMTNTETYTADIRTFHKDFGANLADVIICNPPYFTTGPKSQNAARATARHNDTLSIQDLAAASTRLIKYGGSLYICYPIDQIAYAIQTLENHCFRIKHLHLLPHLVLINAKKSKGSHSTKVTF